jgi:hypothetical protein
VSVTTTPVATTSRATARSVFARWAGALALAHVVVLFGAFALEQVAVENGTAADKVASAYRGADLTRTLLSGYLEALSFFVLIAALVVIPRAFAARTELGRLAGQAFAAFGVAYVAATLAVGFPPGAAALYAAHHGVDPGTIATVNDVRNYGFVLQVALSLAMVLALGVLALAEQRYRLWIGWGGVVLGAAGLLVTPFAHNAMSAVETVWWVGMGIILLRTRSGRD